MDFKPGDLLVRVYEGRPYLRYYVTDNGHMAWTTSVEELCSDREKYLGSLNEYVLDTPLIAALYGLKFP